MAKFPVIPQELLDVIISYVDFNDIKSLRRTCQRFSIILSHKLFDLSRGRLEIIREDNALKLKIKSGHQDSYYQYLQDERLYERLKHLGKTWLRPIMTDLRHLTINFDTYLGFCPGTDLQQIYFRQLASLRLDHYVFSCDGDLKWVLSHGNTLRELYLDNCAILCEAEINRQNLSRCNLPLGYQNECQDPSRMIEYSYNARWHDYFDSFGKNLPSLRYFHIGTIDTPGRSVLAKDRYFEFFDFLHAYPYMVSSQMCQSCDRLDVEALLALQNQIGQRADVDCLVYEGLPMIYEQWGIKASNISKSGTFDGRANLIVL